MLSLNVLVFRLPVIQALLASLILEIPSIKIDSTDRLSRIAARCTVVLNHAQAVRSLGLKRCFHKLRVRDSHLAIRGNLER